MNLSEYPKEGTMFKDFLRNNAAILTVAGISLAISFLIAGTVGHDVWAPHRGR